MHWPTGHTIFSYVTVNKLSVTANSFRWFRRYENRSFLVCTCYACLTRSLRADFPQYATRSRNKRSNQTNQPELLCTKGTQLLRISPSHEFICPPMTYSS